MKLHILGGAGEYGRSCYLLEQKGSAVLFDCGVKRIQNGFQVGEYPLIEPFHTRRISRVLLSHAHEDHCAAIPLLYDQGYRGKIYCSDWTAIHARRLFQSWNTTVERFGGTLPYHDRAVEGVSFESPTILSAMPRSEQLDISVGRSGHLSGSLWFHLKWHGKTFFYSGDFNLSSRLFACDMPKTADVAILDAAYGAESRSREDDETELLTFLLKAVRSSGKVLLPLPQIGRSQEILAFLLERSMIENEIRNISWVIERSIWEHFLEMIQDQNWCFSLEGWEQISTEVPSWIRIVSSDEERIRAIDKGKPQLIIATDGMMNNSVSSFWLSLLGSEPSNAIVLTGYQAPGTVGEQAANGLLQVAAEVVNIRYKVHPNLQEILQMIEALQAKQVILAHQSRDRLLELANILQNKGIEVYLPSPGEQLCF